MPSYSRRTVLATLTGIGLTGCITRSDSESPNEGERSDSESPSGDGEPTMREIEARLPDECSKSLDLDVQWPQEFDADTVGGFVMDYEEVYLVEEYTETRFHSLDFSVELEQTPDKLNRGFQLTVRSAGAGRVDDHLHIQASKVGSDGIPEAEQNMRIDESVVPDDPEYISINEVEDQILHAVLQLAADTGYENHRTAFTPRYEELLDNLPANASLSDRRMGAYFDVNGTYVLLVIDRQGGNSLDGIDVGPIQYYVTEYVIRRTDEESESPEDGAVVECRIPEGI